MADWVLDASQVHRKVYEKENNFSCLKNLILYVNALFLLVTGFFDQAKWYVTIIPI